MAEKRKAQADVKPSKKAKTSDKHDTPKRSKPVAEAREQPAKEKPPRKSLLSQEEKSFPRGGGSVLTPLEQRQIRAQAERDALFEQSTGQKAPRVDDDDDLFDESNAVEVQRKKAKRSKGQDASKKSDSKLKVHSLSYKTLVPGSLVLGRVTAITSKDIALALPNNLTGFVPITAISPVLNKRIEAIISEEAGEEDDVDLQSLFRVGQWLRAVVVESTGRSSSAEKQKRHIELSINPSLVNNDLSADSVATNAFVQASVRSIEDHGIVMDVGLKEESTRGFIGKKELGQGQSFNDLSVGQVMLCLVTGKASSGQVLKLTPDLQRFSAFGPIKNSPVLSELPDVDILLPGVAVDVLLTASGIQGCTGKVMGMVDVSCDSLHTYGGQPVTEEALKKLAVGAKVRARVTSSLAKDDGSRQIGVSFLNHAVIMPPAETEVGPNAPEKLRTVSKSLQQDLATSSVLDGAVVTAVVPERGVYLKLGDSKHTAFAHISQLSDSRTTDIFTESGPYKIGSTHQIRVLNFNPVDGIYYVSLKPSVLSQPFMRLEDVKIGSLVEGKVDRLILGSGAEGVTGVLIRLAKSITALVPATHISDAAIKHPEKKFREGFAVKGRVLSIDTDKHQVRVTLKKTLVGLDDHQLWTDYEKLSPGDESSGTIVKLLDKGAVVQYFGQIRAFLPVSEMSDSYVQSALQHFRLGQTVKTRILSVDPDAEEMRVSCRTGGDIDEQVKPFWERLSAGQVVGASISAILADKIEVELEGGFTGVIPVGHLIDGSANKAESRLKKLRVGQKLNELLVLSKSDRSHQVSLTYKSSMVDAAKQNTTISSFEDAKQGVQVHGFVKNITPEGVFVEFAGQIVGFLPKRQLKAEMLQQTEFGLRRDQSLAAWVERVDEARSRFSLTMNEPSKQAEAITENASKNETAATPDLALNNVTKAFVASVKNSQINVRLADGVHGRIDVSEVFDSWSEITYTRAPLQNRYTVNQAIDVKVLGIRDAKGWRYLPFSHRNAGNSVVELSAKRSRIDNDNSALLTGPSEVKENETYVSFVNNVSHDCVWVSLSPAIRGRVAFLDLSNDVGQLQDAAKHFPIGSALQVRLKHAGSDKLDFVSVDLKKQPKVTLENASAGDLIPCRVTKITEYGVTVQLSGELAAVVPLVELSDDFDQADPAKFSKNDVVRARVLNVDSLNKRISLSLRPSLVLSSSLAVKDAHIKTFQEVKQGSLVRGFVKHIGDKSVIVSISGTVDAFVAVADLSDDFIKDWQSLFQLHQLVKARVVAIDADAKHARLSLKKSQVDGNYVPPLTLADIKTGDIVTGVCRKVEDFGVFIDIDNTRPRISGLAHRSEIAEKRVTDVRELYTQGDKVKAKVLKVDKDSRKINLGLKASYFRDEDAMSIDDASDDGVAIQGLDEPGNMSDIEEDLEVGDANSDVSEQQALDDVAPYDAKPAGLTTSGFDWNADMMDQPIDSYESEPDLAPKQRQPKKSGIKVDLTAELDKHGPQKTSDFERLLLGQPNDSGLWIQYMAFHLQLSEIEKAREIAERALRTIHIRETDEKANIWIALMNLEVEYGDDDSVEAVFKKACQVQDSLEMHEKLVSMYIDSEKQDKADGIFEKMVANKSFRASPEMWLNYATFLMSKQDQPDRARALLARAMQSVPQMEHRPLTAKFGALEYRTQSGNPERGRTIFEALMTEWPRWTAGWDMWVDIERSRLEKLSDDEEKQDAVRQVRQLFERMSKAGMKKRRANFVFKRWLEFEETHGEKKHQDQVKALAVDFVEQLKAKAQQEDADEE